MYNPNSNRPRHIFSIKKNYMCVPVSIAGLLFTNRRKCHEHVKKKPTRRKTINWIRLLCFCLNISVRFYTIQFLCGSIHIPWVDSRRGESLRWSFQDVQNCGKTKHQWRFGLPVCCTVVVDSFSKCIRRWIVCKILTYLLSILWI